MVKDTGHFQKFEPVEIGVLDLTEGQHHLEVRARKIKNIAVMDIQKMTLTPVR